MARVHYWQFLIDEEGKPIEGANVYIFLANSDEAAYIYQDEITGAPTNALPQLRTTAEGFFEFWIGDSSETNGYSSTQKFKLVWERIGIASGMIDYIDIFPPTIPVDESSDNTERNKSVSNKLAKGWEEHRKSTSHIIHGIVEYDQNLDDIKRNRLISNRLGNYWQDHRFFSFNPELPMPSGGNALAVWEDEDSEHYGAHGLQPIDVVDNISNTTYNKLLNNAQAYKWEQHVDFDFSTDTIGTSGFGVDSVHGLKPGDFSPANTLPTSGSSSELEEFNKFNKLVSNRILHEIFRTVTSKATVFNKTIEEDDWTVSLYNDGYYYKLTHGLESTSPVVTCYKLADRKTEDGVMIQSQAMFVPQEIYIENENEIIIYIADKTNVTISCIGDSQQLVNGE